MVDVIDAYRKIVSEIPDDEYIANISEFENLYEFVVLKNWEKLEELDNNLFIYPVVFKADGRIQKDYDIWLDDKHGEHIKCYSESEIKEMMMKRAL